MHASSILKSGVRFGVSTIGFSVHSLYDSLIREIRTYYARVANKRGTKAVRIYLAF